MGDFQSMLRPAEARRPRLSLILSLGAVRVQAVDIVQLAGGAEVAEQAALMPYCSGRKVGTVSSNVPMA
jgi:hypothetical protein